MPENWKLAALGGLGGAAIAVIVVLVLAATGTLPVSQEALDARIHEYLMRNPAVLVDMSNKMQADQAAQEDAARQKAVDKIGLKAFFDPKLAFVTGPADAKTTLVEFFDYNCPYCRASLPAVKKFYEAHRKDTRFAFIEFPIKGQNSIVAAHAAIAARKQPDKYLKFYFALMNEQELATPDLIFSVARKTGLDVEKLKQDMMDKSVDASIKAAHDLAVAAKIDGTPAFIINGRMREGALNDTILAKLAEQHS
ncbi:MAG: thioredoxin domain-containing protein [Proteobacteria bacterium]|nr:thioredoxin domain-containing protein [Pseudomonadota bacterium]